MAFQVKEHFKIALTQPNFLEKEHIIPVPSIRISVNRLLTHGEIDLAVKAIEEACVSLKIYETLLESINDDQAKQDMIDAYAKHNRQKESAVSKWPVIF